MQKYTRFLQRVSIHTVLTISILFAVGGALLVNGVAVWFYVEHSGTMLGLASLLLCIGTATLVVCYVVLRHINFISRPILTFAQLASKIANSETPDFKFVGDLVGSEILELATAFKILVERVSARELDSQKTQSVLETIVADRTINAIKNNTELLIAMDMAEAASKSKTIFLSHMSSMLRTPLNGIILYTELISEQLAESDLDLASIKKDMGKVKVSANKLLGSIDKILELAQVELGHVHLSQDNIITQELLIEAEALARSLVKKNHNLFELVVSPGLPRKFRADHSKVQQVIFSVLDNASKFTKRGLVRLLVDADSEFIIFTIQDTGCGLSSDVQDKLFKGLLRGDSGGEENSFGLSLVLAKRYVDFMGGVITAQSPENQGTIFTVKIPRMAESFAPDMQFRVLIIGKTAQIRDNISLSLIQRGLWVTTTTEYSEGSQLALQLNPQFIIYALDQSDVTAWRNLALLRMNPSLDKCRVIILHCNNKGGGVVGPLQEIIQKPVPTERLAKVLHYQSVTRKRPYILIIEDDKATALALSRQVETHGWVTKVCGSAEEAQPYLAKDPPSLILLDLGLPGMSGLEFIKHIKNQKNLSPVVVVTGQEILGEDLAKLNTGLTERATDEGLIQEIIQRVQKV